MRGDVRRPLGERIFPVQFDVARRTVDDRPGAGTITPNAAGGQRSG
jgi:hypothetical protein